MENVNEGITTHNRPEMTHIDDHKGQQQQDALLADNVVVGLPDLPEVH